MDQLYGEKIDCGGLMAWTWCVSRTIDALADAEGIDITKVVVAGHSRCGKAALAAGAFDARIAQPLRPPGYRPTTSPRRFVGGEVKTRALRPSNPMIRFPANDF